MKFHSKDFRVRKGRKVDLHKWPTKVVSICQSDARYQALLTEHIDKLGSLQSLADIHERKYWSRYRKAYEECLTATSTLEAPWYVVPADDKRNARLMVSHILLATLESLKMAYPTADSRRRQELRSIRRQLTLD